MRKRMSVDARKYIRHSRKTRETFMHHVYEMSDEEVMELGWEEVQDEGWMDVESVDNSYEYYFPANVLGIDPNTRKYMEAFITAMRMYEDTPIIDPIVGRIAMIYAHGGA